MGRRKNYPSIAYERCKLLGELRGNSSTIKGDGLSAKQIQKLYPSEGLKISTINQMATIWHSSHENTLDAFRLGLIGFGKIRELSKLNKEFQLEFLGIASNRNISVADLKEKIASKQSGISITPDRYMDDGFSGKLTSSEKQVQDFLSDKFGAKIQLGRGRTNKLEWRISYYGRDSAIDLMNKFSLVDEFENEDLMVELIGRGFDVIGGRKVQHGDLVVRFSEYHHFTSLLDKLAGRYNFS
jgi:hypothetical protein